MTDKRRPNDGGAAFPVTKEVRHIGSSEVHFGDPGMTLRDWFAGQAVAKMSGANFASFSTCDSIASVAYKIADAMIDEKRKREGEVAS